MKILLTGGGTGGHFYPIIAVVEEIHSIVKDEKIIEPELYYAAPTEYDSRALFDNNIRFVGTSAGKLRHYFSLLNFLDVFKTLWGIIQSLIMLFKIYPDVVFGKGGYVTFPVLYAARLLRIPVVIHESDSIPGRVNKWAGKFAKNIAVSYPEAAQYFPQDKVAFTGNPVRKEITTPLSHGAHEFLKLEENVPVILVLGGSLGSQKINDTLLDSLPQLLNKYQVIHQTGKKNFTQVKNMAELVLGGHPHSYRYKTFDHLNPLAMRMAAGVSNLVISRAGSTIFEIALWGIPSIIIPIPEGISHDQTSNAFNYARSGACLVMEENNLTSNILVSEVERLFSHPSELAKMKEATKVFAHPDAARKIAKVILNIGLSHEK